MRWIHLSSYSTKAPVAIYVAQNQRYTTENER